MVCLSLKVIMFNSIFLHLQIVVTLYIHIYIRLFIYILEIKGCCIVWRYEVNGRCHEVLLRGGRSKQQGFCFERM